jgi:hypothetical protein
MSPNSLKSIALPSMTGMAASGPMSPRPRTAVPSLTTATELPLMVSVPGLARVGGEWPDAHARHARRVGHRERVAGDQRHLVLDAQSCRPRCSRNTRSETLITLTQHHEEVSRRAFADAALEEDKTDDEGQNAVHHVAQQQAPLK